MYPSSNKQQPAASGGGGGLGWTGLGWVGLDEFEGGPSIRFVMAERTVCARLRVGGWVDGWVSERVSEWTGNRTIRQTLAGQFHCLDERQRRRAGDSERLSGRVILSVLPSQVGEWVRVRV